MPARVTTGLHKSTTVRKDHEERAWMFFVVFVIVVHSGSS
jgi:hypothetical protein